MKNFKTLQALAAAALAAVGVARFAVVLALAVVFFGPGQFPASAWNGPKNHPNSDNLIFDTTVAYLVEFYPLWFTYNQSATFNRLIGPDKVTSLYQAVVAVNVDTLYCSATLNLTNEPVVLTIPPTTNTYSILALTPYGDVYPSGIPAQTPGTYAIVGPNYNAAVPGITTITNPDNYSSLLFRVDKYSASGVNQSNSAEAFRAALKLVELSLYTNNPSTGAAKIAPEIVFAVPYKRIADNLIADDPIAFLKSLQTSVAASNTPPLAPGPKALSDLFDALFGDGNFGHHDKKKRAQFAAGAQAAHELILENYLTHTGSNNWIHFTNIGAWSTNADGALDRSGISEFLQYGNDIGAAAYYHAFVDDKGRELNGNNPHGYVLAFGPGEQPQASRFWSVTAYTPADIELVPNPEEKYAVASYTPNLQTNSGSISIYMTRNLSQLPAGVSNANWLSIPPGPFNIMLRVYGPEGSVTNNTFIAPAIYRRH